jgi:hypothetical protein
LGEIVPAAGVRLARRLTLADSGRPA